MANILLDYFFDITAIEPTPQASTGFLKQACLVVSPALSVTTGVITQCTTMAQVAALTDNTEAQQLFNAGMSRVFILPMDDLDLASALEGHESDFYSVLISSDFSDEDITQVKATGSITITSFANLVSGTDDVVTIEGVAFTAQAAAVVEGATTFQAATSDEATAISLAAQINAHATVSDLVVATVDGDEVILTAVEFGVDGNTIGLSYTDNDTNVGITLAGLSGGNLSGGSGLMLGQFEGVVGVSSDDDSYLADQAAISNRAAFHSTTGNKAKNMLYAFGSMLSNALSWRNQQYITMPFADDVDTKGEADALFDDKVSFVISDDEFGERLALFACGGKAIVAPYIIKNLNIDMQSAALSYISGNQPAYTKKEAALLEDELQKVIQSYIDRDLIEAGVVEVELLQDNFVASAEINVSEPKALWRIFGEMRQTL
jgi:hypothetical protein